MLRPRKKASRMAQVNFEVDYLVAFLEHSRQRSGCNFGLVCPIPIKVGFFRIYILLATM